MEDGWEVDMRQPVVLSRMECLESLERQNIGRIAFATRLGLRIVPLNYIYRDGTLLLRVTRGSELDTFTPGAEVAFEVEDLDVENRIAVTAVVQGTAELMANGVESRLLKGELDRVAWVGSRRDRYLQVRMHDVTGRLISGGEPQTSPDDTA
jgi:uncharacterized protein